MSSVILARRVPRDLKNLLENKDFNFIVTQTIEEILDTNILIVKFMTPNKDSPYYYEDKLYSVSINLVHKRGAYPHEPPEVKFLDTMFHPNISTTGGICVDILKEGVWSSLQNFNSIIISLISLLDDPNPSSALNSSACGNLNDPNHIELIRRKTVFYKPPKK